MMRLVLAGVVTGLLAGALTAPITFSALETFGPTYASKIDALQRPEDTVMVIVAARPVPAGTLVREEDLVAIEISPRFVQDYHLFTPDAVVGLAALGDLLENEMIAAPRIGPLPGDATVARLSRVKAKALACGRDACDLRNELEAVIATGDRAAIDEAAVIVGSASAADPELEVAVLEHLAAQGSLDEARLASDLDKALQREARCAALRARAGSLGRDPGVSARVVSRAELASAVRASLPVDFPPSELEAWLATERPITVCDGAHRLGVEGGTP